MIKSDKTFQEEIGSSYRNELRNTSGYTNYVVGVGKTLGSGITSALLKRYYSSIDAELYFNGEWVEDIVSISWNISQKTLPLYGYNSYIWDDVAQGSRIISGEFTIAFTDPNLVNGMIRLGVRDGYGTMSYEDKQAGLLERKIDIEKNVGDIDENPKHYHIWEPSGSRTVDTGLKRYKGFDIDIVCGEKEKMGGEPIHLILKNCVIQQMGTARSSQGGSVAVEQYSFIAQDIANIK